MTITEFIYLSFFTLVIAAQTMCLSQFLHFILGFEQGDHTDERVLSKLGFWVLKKAEAYQIKGDYNTVWQMLSCIFCLNVWVNVATFIITYQFLKGFSLPWAAFFFFAQIVLSHKILNYGNR